MNKAITFKSWLRHLECEHCRAMAEYQLGILNSFSEAQQEAIIRDLEDWLSKVVEDGRARGR